jgi:hypothetical protein
MNKKEAETACELGRKIVKGTALEYCAGNDVPDTFCAGGVRDEIVLRFAGRGVSLTVDRKTVELLISHTPVTDVKWSELEISSARKRWRKAYEKKPYLIGTEGPPGPHPMSRVLFSCSTQDRTRVSKLRKTILGWFRKLYEHDRKRALSSLRAANKKLVKLGVDPKEFRPE